MHYSAGIKVTISQNPVLSQPGARKEPKTSPQRFVTISESSGKLVVLCYVSCVTKPQVRNLI